MTPPSSCPGGSGVAAGDRGVKGPRPGSPLGQQWPPAPLPEQPAQGGRAHSSEGGPGRSGPWAGPAAAGRGPHLCPLTPSLGVRLRAAALTPAGARRGREGSPAGLGPALPSAVPTRQGRDSDRSPRGGPVFCLRASPARPAGPPQTQGLRPPGPLCGSPPFHQIPPAPTPTDPAPAPRLTLTPRSLRPSPPTPTPTQGSSTAAGSACHRRHGRKCRLFPRTTRTCAIVVKPPPPPAAGRVIE